MRRRWGHLAFLAGIGCGPTGPTDGPTVTPTRRVVIQDSAAGLAWPTGLGTDPDGGFYVAEIRAGVVHRFGPDGAFVRHYGQPGDGPGELRLAVAVAAIDSLVIVSDLAHQALEIFHRSTGAPIIRVPLPVPVLVVTPGQAELWLGALDVANGTALLRVDRRSWAVTAFGRLPAVYQAAGAVAANARRVLPALDSGGGLLVGFEAADSLDQQPRDGGGTRLALPRRVRRGLLPDANTALERMRWDEIMIAQSSLAGLATRSDGGILAIHADQRLTQPPPIKPGPNGRLPVTADLFVSVIAADRSRGCVDGRLPGGGELLPQVAMRGDTVFVLDQRTREATAETLVAGYVVDTRRCRWMPLSH